MMSGKKELTIEEFIDLYGSKLPQRVEVVTGMYDGDDEDGKVSLMTGDIYDMHFVRERKTVKLCASSGEQYLLPLNSLFKITPVYGASTVPVKCSTVAEIVQLTPMPKVMCANASYVTSSASSSVAAGEVFTFFSSAARAPENPLRVYSITCQQEKFLDLQCRGDFSTDVAGTSLSLTDALSHIEDLFPSEVVISQLSPLLPQALFNKTARLLGITALKTVVATLYTEGGGENVVIEIPNDSEAEVRVLELQQQPREQLRAQHTELLSVYDETQVKFRKNSADPKRIIRGQSDLFNAVTSEFKVTVPVATPLKSVPETSLADEITSPIQGAPLQSKIEELSKIVTTLSSRCDFFENEITSLRLQLKHVKMMVNKSEVVTSTTALAATPQSYGFSLFNQSTNRDYLSGLTNEQILRLLDFIGLPQYKNIFSTEGINGEIFVRLDDDALKNDLAITSSLHRARILTVVSGQKPVTGLSGLLSGSCV